jgi:hypothetical protein
MRKSRLFVLCAVLTPSPAWADKPACPEREAGSAYPWQNLQPIKGDRHAVLFIDVDKTGRPINCRMGENNIPDPDMRFRACLAYKGDWRAPAAAADEPAVRTITRNFTLIGYEHQMADKKGRKLWFQQHPAERQECYPE